MTRKELEELLKRFDRWKDDLQNERKKLPDGEIAPEDLQRLVQMGLDSDPLRTFLSLASSEPAALDSVAPQAARVATPEGASFDDFMVSLAHSVVSTQKQLDTASAAYLAEIKDKPHIHPSVFRLPKLEAQMKFGLDVKEGKKLNLLFWGKDTETTQQNQQGINFEIVSVPAPPGGVESARKSFAVWRLVIDPVSRGQLIERLSSSGDAVIGRAVENSPDAIAFLELGDDLRTLVLFAEPDDSGKSVGIWLLTETDAGPELETVYRFNRVNGPDEPKMHELVLELAARQKSISGR